MAIRQVIEWHVFADVKPETGETCLLTDGGVAIALVKYHPKLTQLFDNHKRLDIKYWANVTSVDQMLDANRELDRLIDNEYPPAPGSDVVIEQVRSRVSNVGKQVIRLVDRQVVDAHSQGMTLRDCVEMNDLRGVRAAVAAECWKARYED